MTPIESVLAHYTLPFTPYPYQVDVINELAPKKKQGHYLAVGVGKTLTSTCCALYKIVRGEADKVIVLLPPILMLQWKRWLESIPSVTVLMYRGTPKQRKKLKFDAQFTLMTYNMFKNDYERIEREFRARRTITICDEATAIKNIGSANYRAVAAFSNFGYLMLLTGTPIAQPVDAYAYINLIAEGTYRNYNHFCSTHVTKYDFFDKPIEYVDLDVMYKNMQINSVRLLKEDVLDQLPEITYTPVHYELGSDHMKLYQKLVEEQLLEFEDGTKIDATDASRLWHACQQIVCNYTYFSGDPEVRSAAFDLIDETMEELAGRKILIFTNYQMTSKSVAEYCGKWGAVALYGAISDKQQERNVDRFLTDPTCQVMVAHVRSGGYGLNVQDVCSDLLFLEEPIIPIDFEQAVGRCYRNGQKNHVHVRVAVAEGTIQVRLHKLLLDKDELVGQVVRTYKDLREALYGN